MAVGCNCSGICHAAAYPRQRTPATEVRVVWVGTTNRTDQPPQAYGNQHSVRSLRPICMCLPHTVLIFFAKSLDLDQCPSFALRAIPGPSLKRSSSLAIPFPIPVLVYAHVWWWCRPDGGSNPSRGHNVLWLQVNGALIVWFAMLTYRFLSHRWWWWTTIGLLMSQVCHVYYVVYSVIELQMMHCHAV